MIWTPKLSGQSEVYMIRVLYDTRAVYPVVIRLTSTWHNRAVTEVLPVDAQGICLMNDLIPTHTNTPHVLWIQAQFGIQQFFYIVQDHRKTAPRIYMSSSRFVAFQCFLSCLAFFAFIFASRLSSSTWWRILLFSYFRPRVLHPPPRCLRAWSLRIPPTTCCLLSCVLDI